MKNWQHKTLWIGGGVALFAAAFVGFAYSLGGRLSDLRGAPESSNPPSAEPAPPVAVSEKPAPEVRTASTSVLDLFTIDSPYSADELRALAAELREKKDELTTRLTDLDARERRVAERETSAVERFAELDKLRAGLDSWQSELSARALEVDTKEKDSARRDDESWTRLAKLFEGGDEAELAEKLAQYEPKDAARILHALPPKRAKTLLDALEAERWRAFAEAYSKLETDGK